MIQSLTFVGIGILVFFSADWFGRLLSYRADKGEQEGVIRYGGLGGKVWKEDEPEKFASRLDADRIAAAATRWFLKIVGAIFAIGGIVDLLGSLMK